MVNDGGKTDATSAFNEDGVDGDYDENTNERGFLRLSNEAHQKRDEQDEQLLDSNTAAATDPTSPAAGASVIEAAQEEEDEDDEGNIDNSGGEDKRDSHGDNNFSEDDEETLSWAEETASVDDPEGVDEETTLASKDISRNEYPGDKVGIKPRHSLASDEARSIDASGNGPEAHSAVFSIPKSEFSSIDLSNAAPTSTHPDDNRVMRDENRRLREEIYRLREETREKDLLISTLESQIMALVVAGRETAGGEDEDDTESDINSLPDGGEGSKRNSKKSIQTERRSSGSGVSKYTFGRKESTSSTIENTSSVVSSLSPPRRSSIEMKHPPAPMREPGKRPSLVPSTSRKSCFQKSTAAIRALPRELSISNHSRHYLNNDDDEGGSAEKYRAGSASKSHKQRQKPPELYEVEETEFIDAYNSRGIYSGTVQVATQMPHGKGKMVYHRGGREGGRYYDGDWHLGHWHGNGIIRDVQGDIYEGQVVNDLREGIGTIRFTDGRIFRGRFFQDEASEGTMSYIDGAQYKGELHHGTRHGFGIYRFADGSYYEGESVMNLFEGRGKMTWSDGGWYEGEWSRGEIHGFGKEYRPDGSLRHDGRWIKGVPIRTKNYHR